MAFSSQTETEDTVPDINTFTFPLDIPVIFSSEPADILGIFV